MTQIISLIHSNEGHMKQREYFLHSLNRKRNSGAVLVNQVLIYT